MPRMFKVILLGFVLGAELVFFAVYNPYPHGEVHDVRYRQKQRLKTLVNYTQNPSPATKATFEKELYLMHKHEDWKTYFKLGLLVALNGFGIYYCVAKFKIIKTKK